MTVTSLPKISAGSDPSNVHNNGQARYRGTDDGGCMLAPTKDVADQALEAMGYKAELTRTRSTLHVAFMSFVLASVPYGLATMLAYPIIGGGPVAVIWGWLAVSAIIFCVAASLAEITSVYPTAGGVYYQTFMLAPSRWRRVAAWVCGWFYTVGTISITLSVNFGTTLFFVSCINVFETESGVGIFAPPDWQLYLVFVGITLLCTAVSSLGNRWLHILDTAAIFWTLAGVLAIIITILIMAKGGRRSADFVFTHFESNSGWPDGWSFMVGLLHAAYATSSTGMIISMCEEVKEPSTQVPKAMLATVCINTFAGLLFMIPLMFVLPDIQDLLSSSQPVPVIIKAAVGSPGASIALCLPLLVLGVICGIGCTTAASRCTWACARDGAIPGSRLWMQVHPGLGVPLNAILLCTAVQIVLGLIWFGSTQAFNAFSGVGVITLTAAYASPIAISLFTGRKAVENAKFSLGRFGVFANIVALGMSKRTSHLLQYRL
ncbi:unnamed protein product [Clonostachys rhizophaga]|uniref:Uncharacterized protein n=1 Tax=Clonostachys rhizophaga TaxID=160324 RepID=A0A9N9VRV2_9HYPO|nr:unnamed protein product [Clonostachys rhizophaga]